MVGACVLRHVCWGMCGGACVTWDMSGGACVAGSMCDGDMCGMAYVAVAGKMVTVKQSQSLLGTTRWMVCILPECIVVEKI